MSDPSKPGEVGLRNTEDGLTDAANVVHASEYMRQRIAPSRAPEYLFYTTGYNGGMLTVDDIKRALVVYGGRQAALAAAVGVSQPTVSRWLKGATPDPAQEARLREVLSGTPSNSMAASENAQTMGQMRQAIGFGERDLPVYAAVEGGPGELVISTEPIDYVPRPWYLGQVREGYGVYVVGESMVPAYMPGDMAIVHPKMPVIINKTYIFTNDAQDGSFLGTIKRLVGQTATHWKVEQHNPHKAFLLSKAEWPKALRVVGKFEG